MLKPILATVAVRNPALFAHPILLHSSPIRHNPQPNLLSHPLLPPEEPALCNRQTPPSLPPFLQEHLAHPEKVTLRWERLGLFLFHSCLRSQDQRQSCVILGHHCHRQTVFFPLPLCCTNPCFLRLTPLTCHLLSIANMHGLPELPPPHIHTSYPGSFSSWLPDLLSTPIPATFLATSMYMEMTHPPC